MTHPVADAEAVAEVAIDKPPALPSRRDVLKLGAIVTSAMALGASADAAHADDDAPLSYGASQASDAAVALPSLAVIALNRLAWGPRPGEVDAFNALGADDATRLTAWVTQQLDPGFLAQLDDSDNRIAAAAANLPSLNLPIAQLWEAYYKAMSADRSKPARDARVATLIRAVYSPKQLREVITDFWHNHFSVFAWDGSYAGATWASYDRDAIRPYVLGNFRRMLEAVTRSTAMLFYLDNFINQVAGFNENWSRELMELHTLGTENYFGTVNPATVPKDPVSGVSVGYTDEDVYEGAACFTGWRVNNGQSGAPGNTGEFYYHEAWHDKRGKDFMGKDFAGFDAPLKDGQNVLDILAAHPGTARYIVRKLWRRLIGDNAPEASAPGTPAPPNPTFDAAVAKWIDCWRPYNPSDPVNPGKPENEFQISEVVRILVTSPEFKSTWGQKVKRPHEVLYSALRALPTNIVIDGGGLSSLWSAFNAMGQEMFGRRTPDGYPDIRDAWTNSTSMLYRWRTFNSLMENSLYNTSSNTGVQMDNATLISLMGGLNTPTTIADFWINRILNRPMDDPNHRLEVIKLMQGWDTGNNSTSVKPVYAADAVMTATDISNRLRRMIAVILMSPEFQWR
jgi:uncharacterized protein (DUF1800 family)